MASFEFQCDPKLLSKEQIDFIRDVLVKHGFDGGKVVFENIGKANDNYGSNVKRITVEGSNGETLKMVAKIAHSSELHRTMSGVDVIFKNEFLIYAEVFPTFRKLQLEAGIEENDIFKFPKCYGVYEEQPYEIILLEDLREQDYVMLDKCKVLSDQEVRIILKELAKLHSLSFVLKEKDPSTYKKLANGLVDWFTSQQMEDNLKLSGLKMEEDFSRMLDSDRYRNSMKGAITCMIHEGRKLSKYDNGSKYNVILHGDSWTNNILFKLKDGVPQTCMLIDYQLSIEKSPVRDTLYLIFCCTDYDSRSKYYDDWMEYYHTQLGNYLSLYGIKVNYAFPKEKMLSDLKRYSKFFLGWSLVFSKILVMKDETAAELKDGINENRSLDELLEKMEEQYSDSTTQDVLKTRIQGILESYYELGYCS